MAVSPNPQVTSPSSFPVRVSPGSTMNSVVSTVSCLIRSRFSTLSPKAGRKHLGGKRIHTECLDVRSQRLHMRAKFSIVASSHQMAILIELGCQQLARDY